MELIHHGEEHCQSKGVAPATRRSASASSTTRFSLPLPIIDSIVVTTLFSLPSPHLQSLLTSANLSHLLDL